MLDFKKLILNSIQIEDVAEVQDELGKKILSLWFNFFLFNWMGGWVGVEINDNSVVFGGKPGLFKWFLDFSCGGKV